MTNQNKLTQEEIITGLVAMARKSAEKLAAADETTRNTIKSSVKEDDYRIASNPDLAENALKEKIEKIGLSGAIADFKSNYTGMGAGLIKDKILGDKIYDAHLAQFETFATRSAEIDKEKSSDLEKQKSAAEEKKAKSAEALKNAKTQTEIDKANADKLANEAELKKVEEERAKIAKQKEEAEKDNASSFDFEKLWGKVKNNPTMAGGIAGLVASLPGVMMGKTDLSTVVLTAAIGAALGYLINGFANQTPSREAGHSATSLPGISHGQTAAKY